MARHTIGYNPPGSLRDFRHGVAVLKDKGIITGIDARKADPWHYRNGERLSKLVERYDDIITGKATAVKLPPKEATKFAKLGYDVIPERGKRPRQIVIPHSAVEKVEVSHGKVTIINPAGIDRVQVPVEYHNLEQYLADLQSKAGEIDRMKRKGEYFAFRFYGNNSHAVFANMDLLADDLQHYHTVSVAIHENLTTKQREIYRNLEIIRIHRPANWHATPEGKHKKQIYTHKKYLERKARLRKGPQWKRIQTRANNAKANRDYRQRMKQNRTKYDAYLKAGAKRVHKFRRKKP